MSKLVLTRRENESIMIGDDIEVTVVDLRHGQAKLLIEAPRSVKVHRFEIWQQIRLGLQRPSDAMRVRRSGT